MSLSRATSGRISRPQAAAADSRATTSPGSVKATRSASPCRFTGNMPWRSANPRGIRVRASGE